MDAIDILGGMLGRKIGGAGGGSLGGKILKDMLDGFTKRGPAPPAGGGSAPRPPSSGGSATGGGDIESAARQLEEMLGVAVDRNSRRAPSPAPRTTPREEPIDIPRQSPSPSDLGRPQRPPAAPPTQSPIQFPLPTPQPSQNDQALVLVRAMVNAAKADGQLSPGEQQAILQQVGEASAEMMQFLREEFAKPLDVREFCWSVPLGLEQQVYALSLIAMDLSSPSEKTYLRDLAHGLRLRPEACEQIHARLNAPAGR
ncbi:MAG: tellurite resistance TerB family protein [Pirellulales bacterium]|nr:tellurite resistance TerB family protein [Pirellulales bacterium]